MTKFLIELLQLIYFSSCCNARGRVEITELGAHDYLARTSDRPGCRIQIWHLRTGLLGLRQGGLNWYEGDWLAVQLGTVNFGNFALSDSRVIQEGEQGVIDFTWRAEILQPEMPSAEIDALAEPEAEPADHPGEKATAWLRIRVVFLPEDEHTYLQITGEAPGKPKAMTIRASNLLLPLDHGARFARTTHHSLDAPVSGEILWHLEVKEENYVVWYDKTPGGAPCTLWFPAREPERVKIILTSYMCFFEAQYPQGALLGHLVFAEYGQKVPWQEKVYALAEDARAIGESYSRINWSPAPSLSPGVAEMRREAERLASRDESLAVHVESELERVHNGLTAAIRKWESSEEEVVRAAAEIDLAGLLSERIQLLNRLKRDLLFKLIEERINP